MPTIEGQAYWAVIPAVIRRDDVLPANAKLLYGDLSALTNERGYCYATNSYLGGLYGWTDRTVQRLLAALEERNYIQIEQIPGKERRIFCGVTSFSGPPTKLSPHPRQKRQVTPDKIVAPHNNVDKDSDSIPPLPPSGGQEPPFCSLPLRDGTFYQVTQEELRKWKSLFPRVDVEQQLRSMTAWLSVSPERLKTRRGIGRFIVSWLSRRADKPPERDMKGVDSIGQLVL